MGQLLVLLNSAAWAEQLDFIESVPEIFEEFEKEL
jgi:hypothetical protein